jgi:hypothetical protein
MSHFLKYVTFPLKHPVYRQKLGQYHSGANECDEEYVYISKCDPDGDHPKPLVPSAVVQCSVTAIELKSVVCIHINMEFLHHLHSSQCAVVGNECVMAFGF